MPVITLSLLIWVALLPPTRAQQQQPRQQPAPNQQPTDARPRRAEPTTKTGGTTPTPTPTPQRAPGAPTMQSTPPTKADDAAPKMQDPQNQEQEIDPDEVVTIESRLVSLNVRVIDRFNRPINDIRKEDFRVYENGAPQTVEFFTRAEVPIQYGLVIDNSGSLRHQINQVIDAGKTIVNSNKPGDETFLVRFVDRDKIEVKQDFTADPNLLSDALEDLYVEGGQTAVIDAVYLSAERVAEHKKGVELSDRRRRALILITDGEDRASFYSEKDLFASLREQDVQIYVIGFVNELDKEGGIIRKSKREKATELLNRMAKETGGRAFYPNALSELPGIANEITRDLRTQYVLGYNPTNRARDGSFRAIRVTVADSSGRDKRIAVTRPGYNAPRDGAGATTATPSKTLDRATSSKRP